MVLMAKQPERGHSKTRLTPPLSSVEAAELFHCFLLDKIEQMRQADISDMTIAYWPESAYEYFAKMAPGFKLILQIGDGLAARLHNVFDVAFAMGYTQVLAIDGDTPTLPPTYLQEGFQTLDDPSVDVVLGPCEDGGYYAIGMKSRHATLFEVTMSTPNVLRDTLARADKAGLRAECLPQWYDVDQPEDLLRLASELSGKKSATADFLARLALPDNLTSSTTR
jgi:rSAM/selenodomain-associated transferase 1